MGAEGYDDSVDVMKCARLHSDIGKKVSPPFFMSFTSSTSHDHPHLNFPADCEAPPAGLWHHTSTLGCHKHFPWRPRTKYFNTTWWWRMWAKMWWEREDGERMLKVNNNNVILWGHFSHIRLVWFHTALSREGRSSNYCAQACVAITPNEICVSFFSFDACQTCS